MLFVVSCVLLVVCSPLHQPPFVFQYPVVVDSFVCLRLDPNCLSTHVRVMCSCINCWFRLYCVLHSVMSWFGLRCCVVVYARIPLCCYVCDVGVRVSPSLLGVDGLLV